MARDTEQIIEAADNLTDLFAMGWDMMDDVLGGFSCTEAEAIAALVRATGADALAERILDAHSFSDEDGDEHFGRQVPGL